MSAGASALGKKQRKRFKASMLSKLNAKAEKASRIPASVGKGQYTPPALSLLVPISKNKSTKALVQKQRTVLG